MEKNLDSFRISLESFGSFRGTLLPKPITGQELFFAVSYSKPALEPLIMAPLTQWISCKNVLLAPTYSIESGHQICNTLTTFLQCLGLLNNMPTPTWLKIKVSPRACRGSLFWRPCHNASPLPNLYRKWSHETSSFMHTFHLIHNHQAYFRVPNKHFDLNT